MSNKKNPNGQEFIRNISHYKGNERRFSNRRRSEPVGGSSLIPDDLTPSIKNFIAESLENQKRQAKINQQKADAETLKTEAIKSFLLFIKDFMENDLSKRPTNHRGKYKTKPPDAKHKKVFNIVIYFQSVQNLFALGMGYN